MSQVALKTDNTDYVPVMTYAKSEKVREDFWKLYRMRAHPKNGETLNQMLAKRYEMAKLLGFDNWADYVTANKMIGSGKNAAEFIEKITNAAAERSKKDYADLLARKERYYYSIMPSDLEARLEHFGHGFDVDYCLRRSKSILAQYTEPEWLDLARSSVEGVSSVGGASVVWRHREAALRGSRARRIALRARSASVI